MRINYFIFVNIFFISCRTREKIFARTKSVQSLVKALSLHVHVYAINIHT